MKDPMLKTHGPLTLVTFLLQMQVFWDCGIDRVSSGAFGSTYGYGPTDHTQLNAFVVSCPETEWIVEPPHPETKQVNHWIVRKPVLQFSPGTR